MRRSRLGLFVLPALAVGVAVGPISAGRAARPQGVSAIQPNRVLDTRIGLGAPASPLVLGVDLAVAVPAPAGATSVALNLTATDAVADGWLKAWPCDEAEPSTSSLNFTPGQTSANAAVVRLAAGKVCLASSQPVQVVADVTGWYIGASDFTAASPNRLLDTRVSGNPLIAGTVRRLKVAGTAGVGANATIGGLNLTVDRPGRAGYVVAFPCGQPTNGSTVNFSAGETVANFTIVGLTAGEVCMASSTDVQIIVDSFGWSTGGGQLKVQSPTRLLDTRDPATWGVGTPASGDTVRLRVAGLGGVPNSADAALLTVTVANPAGNGYVTTWPCDQPFPVASTINTFPNALRSNLSLVKLSQASGEVCLKYVSANATPTDLIVDAIGWIDGNVTRTAPGVTNCGLAAPAFCETFDAPAGAGTRTGDLNPVLWGVSRIGDTNPGQHINDIPIATMAGCAAGVAPTPNDVRICNGQMYEAVNDGGGVINLNTYPKQPFNFAGRTGKVTFDVSADSDGSHGAWPEFVITDKPVPGVRRSISSQVPAAAANSIGFTLDGGCNTKGLTGVGGVFVTKNNVYSEPGITTPNCITKGSAKAMNHFEVRISQNRLEVWGTDAGATNLKQLAVADNLGLTFTQGLVWLDDVHYNARKAIEPCECGTQFNHTFVWDNLGFDGPKTYRDLGFDVADSNTVGQAASAGDPSRRVGYQVGLGTMTLTTDPVRRDQTPTGALLVLNSYSFVKQIPSVSINGGPWIDTPWPFTDAQTYSWRSLAIPIPLDQVHDGANTIAFKSGDASTLVSNISIILVAGSPVP